MTKFKDFGAGTPVNTEPIEFKLHGETFQCRPAVQGKVMLDLMSGFSGGDDNSATSDAAEVIETFFSVVLYEESYARFNALVVDPERIVSVETLAEIAGWLTEQYASRPTQPSNTSPSGD